MSTLFNPETALDTMTQNTILNDENERLTLYCIVCPEHGGLVARSASEAIKAAQNANIHSDGCSYYPVAIGLDARIVQAIFAEPPEGS